MISPVSGAELGHDAAAVVLNGRFMAIPVQSADGQAEQKTTYMGPMGHAGRRSIEIIP